MIVRSDNVRRALAERVATRVAGAGISRRVVEETVDRVVSALGARASVAGAVVPASEPTVVAALMSRSSPDLASRVRAALQSAGAPVIDLGTASAGRYTVVTVRVPAGARAALEAAASSMQLALTFVPDDSTLA